MMGQPSFLFKGEMIRALRNGQPGVWPAAAIDGERPLKWQTRRVMPLQPPQDVGTILVGDYHPTVIDGNGDYQPGLEIFGAYDDVGEWGAKCPYGRPGDVAWVRETWAAVRFLTDWETGYVDDIAVPRGIPTHNPDEYWTVVHKADNVFDNDIEGRGFAWKPSIHMPRWASRDDLLIKWIRAERVQDISDVDAIAEGIEKLKDSTMWRHCDYISGCHCFGTTSPRASFAKLWDGINGQPKKKKSNPYTGQKEVCYVSYPWADERGEEKYRGLVHYVIGNPWVWAVAFMRMGDREVASGG